MSSFGARTDPGAADGIRFEGLLDAAPDAIVGVDATGQIVLVNRQAERLFGYDRRELVGQPVEVLVPAGMRARHPKHRRGYLRDPKPREMGAGMELSARCKDGREFPAEISLNAVETSEGVIVAAAIRDTTERRRLAAAQAALAAIVRSSHDAIFGISLDATITSWNPGAERLYGYEAQEIVARSVEVLFPPSLRHQEREILARIARGERVDQYQAGRLRKDGSLVPVVVTVSPIADTAGAITGMASVSRDISERELAEAKFRGLLEAAPDAIVGVGGDGRIALANAEALRLFGYDRGELVGQPVEILVPEAARAVHPGHRDAYFATPVRRPMGAGMQLAGRRRDGSQFPAEISLSAIETEEGILVSAAVRDVSDRLEAQAERERLTAQAERERLERQLHQSQRLESLGQLAGGVAHDFNNLLGVIINYAAFVAEEVESASAVDSERWAPVGTDIAEIQRAAERASRLTHQLLAFGRREIAQPRVLNLNDVVGDVERLLRRTLGEHIEMLTELEPELWNTVADSGQIEQVLVNLAVNARDAMPGGGRLVLETDNVMVDHAMRQRRPALKEGPHVRLRIGDTGSGMPREVAEHAFEPFYTTKPKGEGSGLGLATVYGIVTQAGGHVEIYSEIGLGTTISVLLPASGEIAVAVEAPPAAGRPRGGETVLVVEDEDAIRELTRRILVRHGYEVIVAGRGEEAIDLAVEYQGPIDLLVTDVVMPQMLGKEVAEKVRAVRPEIGVLYMSGYAQPVLASQGTLEPGVWLIEKPFSEDLLLAKVREVLDPPAGAEHAP